MAREKTGGESNLLLGWNASQVVVEVHLEDPRLQRCPIIAVSSMECLRSLGLWSWDTRDWCRCWHWLRLMELSLKDLEMLLELCNLILLLGNDLVHGTAVLGAKIEIWWL
jgi:hypothetical protein